ncbi:Diadenosine tetraphosphate (Ap4A) hydrolase [Devosia sp. YR412]|uniref:HIT family protein n=1 Tax=Devosia sp. YR412 TaxID=1881030 RepID=UPI0008B3706D|nr:HIT domain-containing protein [Devosia sp. YR412]SEQ09965.1 Diadenosine tetraphosphate (Ap4A) hydrolase [Devosia sp. YR412]
MPPNCPFCQDNRTGKDPALLANRSCYLLRTPDPVLSCGGMIIPYRHIATPFELDPEEWNDAFELLLRAKLLFDEEGAQGYNVGWNVGDVAGQTVPHVHLHIVGRFADEPLVGHGIRHHLKQKENIRPARP